MATKLANMLAAVSHSQPRWPRSGPARARRTSFTIRASLRLLACAPATDLVRLLLLEAARTRLFAVETVEACHGGCREEERAITRSFRAGRIVTLFVTS